MTRAHNMTSSDNKQSEMLWKEIWAATKNYIQLSVTLLLHKLWYWSWFFKANICLHSLFEFIKTNNEKGIN